MRRAILLATAACLGIGPGASAIAQDRPGASAVAEDRIGNRAWARAVRLLDAHLNVLEIPGMQIAVGRRGRLVWSRGFGFADLESRVPVTASSRFPIASVSKSLTAVAAAALVADGRLEWDAPVRRYVPSFPAGRGEMTARQLAAHLSGIRHYRPGEAAAAGARHYDDVVDALALFAEDSLLSAPGAEFHYSSYGYNLLSAVVQAAAGRPFPEVVRRRVLAPAGLRSTSPAFPDSLIPDRAETYVEGADGGRLRAPTADPSYKWGSGGYMSTAEDLVRFGQALLDGALLDNAAVERLWTETETADGGPTGWGLGFQLLETSGRKVVYHGGNLDYARAHLLIVPSESLVMAVLANTGQGIGFNDEEMLALADLFVRDAEPPGVDPSGRYMFRTTWQDEPAVGYLEIRPEGDDYVGTLSFPTRSRPVAVVDVQGDTVHLIAVPGSWMHLWLDFSGPEIQGRWAWGPFEASIDRVRRLNDF